MGKKVRNLIHSRLEKNIGRVNGEKKMTAGTKKIDLSLLMVSNGYILTHSRHKRGQTVRWVRRAAVAAR